MSNGRKSPKKKRRRSGARKVLFAVVPVVIAFAVVFTVSKTVGTVAFSNVTDVFASFSHRFSGQSSFPYNLGGATLHGMESMGSSLLLAKSDCTVSVNSSASELFSQKNTFSTPAADVNNGRAVVYDRSADSLLVMSKTELLHEFETSSGILCASVGKNGFVAVATLGSDASSIMTVYDRHMKEYFKWKCIADYISDMSISDNGKYIVVSVVGVSQADTCSKVHIFDFDKDQAVASFEYDGTVIVDVEFTKNDTVTVLGDNLRSIITDNSERLDSAFSGDTLSCFDCADNGRTAVVTLTYGSELSPKLHVYAKNGELSFEKELGQRAEAVSCSGTYTAVLLQNSAVVFDNVGNQIGSVSFNDTANDIVVTGSGMYIAFADRVVKCPVNSSGEEITE